MRITADTNVLIRAAVEDEPHQARLAAKILQETELVAVPTPVLCEFVWVLRRGYKKSASEVLAAIHKLMLSPNVSDEPVRDRSRAFRISGGRRLC